MMNDLKQYLKQFKLKFINFLIQFCFIPIISGKGIPELCHESTTNPLRAAFAFQLMLITEHKQLAKTLNNSSIL